jgi:large subunit ribosomal protein L25
MERITLNAEKRSNTGKGVARSLRRQELIPAVLYRGGESTPMQFAKKELAHFINSTAGEQVMVNIQFSDGDSRLALMKDFQLEPSRGELLHADFFELLLTEEVKVTVHIATAGEPVGVKRDGGLLQILLREIEIECLPDKIPGHIRIDISRLEIGQALHVSDLQIGEGIKILNDPDEVIVNVIAPAVEAAPAEEAAIAPVEAKEPELIKKGKKEEEGEGEA